MTSPFDVDKAWANSRLKNGPSQAAKLLDKMYKLHRDGDLDIKPNVVTYCAVVSLFFVHIHLLAYYNYTSLNFNYIFAYYNICYLG